jgi:hypothetical protein
MTDTFGLGSFRTLVQGLAQTAIQIAGDLCVAVAYNPTGTIGYNPTTGAIVNSGTQITGINGLLVRFTDDEVNQVNNSVSDRRLVGVVNPTDMKLLLAALDLGVQPNINDTLITTDTSVQGSPQIKTWKVVRIMSLPGNPLYKLHCRET